MIGLIKTLQYLFRLVFRLPAGTALGIMRLAGRALYRIARLTPIRKTVMANLRRIIPDCDAAPLAEKLLQNFSLSVFEFLCSPYFRAEHFERVCKLSGTDNIDLALTGRKGALLLSMHTGNYEIVPAALAARGYRVSSILKAPSGDPLFKLLNRIRSYKGTEIINVTEGNMYRHALQALARNRCVCTLVDTGALEGRHEMIRFLGKRVPVATGWLALAQRSGAPVVPVLIKRDGDQVAFSIGEPLAVTRDNREEIMRRVGALFENFIRNHPDQWGIFLNEQETRRMIEGK